MPTILIKKSDTPGAAPTGSDLTNLAGGAEIAVNTADKRVFSMNSSSAIIELGTNPGSLTTADASATVFRSGSATITDLIATSASITTLTATSASVTNLTATSLVLSNLSIASANVTTLTSGSATITNLLATSLTVSSGSTLNGGVVVNEPGADVDFRVEGDTDANLFFVDASADAIGIGTSSPSYKLDAQTTATGTAAGDNTVAFFGSLASGRDANIRFGDSVNASARIGYLSGALYMYTNGAERLRLDLSGNLGLGVTPETWNSTSRAIQIGATAQIGGRTGTTEAMTLGSNCYNNTSGNWAYIISDEATLYEQYGGAHYWRTAASGSADATISFTQAMTLDASGNLGVGTASPGQLLSLQKTGTETQMSLVSDTNQACAIYMGDTAATLRGLIQYNNNGDYMRFYTAGSERARITSGGAFVVNATAAVDTSQAGVAFDGVNANGIGINDTASANGSGLIKFLTGGTVRGSVTNDNNTGVLYNLTSDERLKKNIANADDFGDVIDAIQVRKFDWKENDSHTRAGFVAQELITVAPEAVYKPSKEEDMMGVDYSKLVPMLVKEIQSLRARVAALEAK